MPAHHAPPEPPIRIVLDLDATDDPIYGQQEGRHFHGYYDCYCYVPLYIFCGRHLLAAKLRSSSDDAAAGSVEEKRYNSIAYISPNTYLYAYLLRTDPIISGVLSLHTILIAAPLCTPCHRKHPLPLLHWERYR